VAELSPEGEDLVRSGRQADQPTDADRERVRRALEARLGLAIGSGAAGTGGAMPSGARPAGRWALARWVSVGLAGLAGAGLFFAPRGTGGVRGSAGLPAARPIATATATSGIGQGPAPNDGEERATASGSATSAADAPARAPAQDTREALEGQRPSPSINARPSDAAHPRSTLSEEVLLLSRAETDLHAGRFESALRSLDEHERRFPRGALEPERTSARAQALCALGRNAEAQASLEQLARTAPNSPNEERARQACREASH
jgi:hypothetical protein